MKKSRVEGFADGGVCGGGGLAWASGRVSEREGRSRAAIGGGALIHTCPCPRVHACIVGAFGFLPVYSPGKKAGSGAHAHTFTHTLGVRCVSARPRGWVKGPRG